MSDSAIYSLFHCISAFFFTDPPTSAIYTLSLHDALPICYGKLWRFAHRVVRHKHGVFRLPGVHAVDEILAPQFAWTPGRRKTRSEEHTSELQSRRDIVCRLLLEKKKKKKKKTKTHTQTKR